MLCLLVSVRAINECPFGGLRSATFFTFLYFWLLTLLFKIASKQSVEVLFSVSKGKKAGMCLLEKVRV